ncbi:hypothetical protein HU200_066429 [Digitaria exilis]|uniref:Uncharacterized protein n=1 Tax=Digitaria exilis TaxID=1010633 RepID=A0A835DTZ7_9POAL|nr:hypothetical protein HU200_066429 [Digitaria exilis]
MATGNSLSPRNGVPYMSPRGEVFPIPANARGKERETLLAHYTTPEQSAWDYGREGACGNYILASSLFCGAPSSCEGRRPRQHTCPMMAPSAACSRPSSSLPFLCGCTVDSVAAAAVTPSASAASSSSTGLVSAGRQIRQVCTRPRYMNLSSSPRLDYFIRGQFHLRVCPTIDRHHGLSTSHFCPSLSVPAVAVALRRSPVSPPLSPPLAAGWAAGAMFSWILRGCRDECSASDQLKQVYLLPSGIYFPPSNSKESEQENDFFFPSSFRHLRF